jgi:tRNA1(Val) A37 N6-methylase TrmN6
MFQENYSKQEKMEICRQIKNISCSMIEREFQQLIEIAKQPDQITNISARCRVGNNIVDMYTFPARLEVKGKYNVNFYEFLANLDYFQTKKFICNMTQYYEQTKNKNKTKNHVTVCKEIYNICVNSINIIRPLVYMEIYAKYRPKHILDFCAGWGGAAVAAATFFPRETEGNQKEEKEEQPSSKHTDLDFGSDFFLESYTGIEINHALKEPYRQLVSFLETQHPSCAKKINMCFTDALNVDYSLLWYDFVFTSPPYYFIQKYENNSHFSNKEEMNEKFYFPLFQKTFASLQPNGVYAMNVCKEVYTSVLLKLFGEPDECFPYKKSKRQNNYQEMVYVWRKNKK